jgi:hypothetical protein
VARRHMHMVSLGCLLAFVLQVLLLPHAQMPQKVQQDQHASATPCMYAKLVQMPDSVVAVLLM